MNELKKYADYIVYLSLVPVVLAVYGAFAGSDLWLASTQWLLIAILFVAYGVYLKHD